MTIADHPYFRLWPMKLDRFSAESGVPNLTINCGRLSDDMPTVESFHANSSASTVAEGLREVLEAGLRRHCRAPEHRQAEGLENVCQVIHAWQTPSSYEYYGFNVRTGLFNFLDALLQQIAELACLITNSPDMPAVGHNVGPRLSLEIKDQARSLKVSIFGLRASLPDLRRGDAHQQTFLFQGRLSVSGPTTQLLIDRLHAWVTDALMLERQSVLEAAIYQQLVQKFGAPVFDKAISHEGLHAIQVKDRFIPGKLRTAIAVNRNAAIANALAELWNCSEQFGCCLPESHAQEHHLAVGGMVAQQWSQDATRLASATS